MYAEQNINRLGLGYGAAALGSVHSQDAQTTGRQLEVPGAVNRIESNVAALNCTIDALDARLTGYIARPQPPSPANEKGMLKGAPGTGLGSQLESISELIDRATLRLNNLMERLEA